MHSYNPFTSRIDPSDDSVQTSNPRSPLLDGGTAEHVAHRRSFELTASSERKDFKAVCVFLVLTRPIAIANVDKERCVRLARFVCRH